MEVRETTASSPSVAPIEEEASLSNRRGRLLVGGFTAAHLAHHLSNSLLNPLLPLIRDSFALSYAQSGFLVSAFSLSLGLSNAPMGVLADRLGSRPVVVAGLVLTGAVSAAVAFANGYWELLALLVLMGVIGGTYHAPSAALLARAFPPRVRGTAMGMHITGGHLSFFLTPLIGAWLVSMTGTWRTPYLWLAFVPVLLAGVIWYLAPSRHEPTPGGLGRLAVFREIGTVIRTVGPLVSMSILFQMVYHAQLAFLTLYLVDARDFSPLTAAVLFSVPQFVGLFGAPLGGYLSDRLGRRAVILIGMVALGPSLYALTAVPAELVVIPLATVGFFAAMRHTVTEVLVTETAPPHRRATVLGGYYLLAQELGGVAAPVFGLTAGLVGIGAAFGGASLSLAALSVLVLLFRRKL